MPRTAERARGSSRPRQAEHTLGQDVALDLRRAREERGGAVVEVCAREPPASHGTRTRLPAQADRAEELHQRVVHALAHLAPEELDEARLGTERLLALKARQRPPVVEPRDLDLDQVLREALPEHLVLTAGRRAVHALAREPEELVQQHAVDD